MKSSNLLIIKRGTCEFWLHAICEYVTNQTSLSITLKRKRKRKKKYGEKLTVTLRMREDCHLNISRHHHMLETSKFT